MMKPCKNIKDLILTDYLDGEADRTVQAQVEEHVAFCEDCRLLLGEVKEKLGMPFKTTARGDVPFSLWLHIREKIEKEPRLEKGDFFSWIVKSFSFFSYWAPVAAAAGFVILISTLSFHYQLAEKHKTPEQAEYLVSLWRLSDAVLDIQDDADQTPLEKYFL